MTNKRLYRSQRNRIVAGLFGGLGEYVGLDPVILRLAWILVVVFTGFVPGIVAYLLAILVVPKETEK